MTFNRQADRLRRDRPILRQRQPQRVLHRLLAVARRQLQNLQVFPSRHPRRVIAQQLIVGHAKVARGKHVRLILIVFERPRFPHQRVDHVPVIDDVLAVARQSRHRLDLAARPPDFDHVGVDHHVNVHADQPTGNRIRVAADLNRAAAADLDAADTLPMIELARRQLAEARLLLGELVDAARIPFVDQPHQKLFVLLPAGEVAAATQQERLIDGRFQMAVRRLDVTVLMRLSSVDPLRLDLVVVHQVAVALAKLATLRKVVDRGAQAVAAMPPRHAAELPEGLLKAAAESLERFGETDRRELPIRVGEREVIQHVTQRLAIDRHAERVHVREVRCAQPARGMHLRKDDRPVRAVQTSPIAHPPLERPPLRVGESARMRLLQPGEQGERPQPRLCFESSLHLGPDVDKRVRPRPPIPWCGAVRRQSRRIAILPCRLLIHASAPRRHAQPIAPRQQPPQFPHLSIRDHRNLHVFKELRLSSRCPKAGILIVAHCANACR